jgi:hypothetical protein
LHPNLGKTIMNNQPRGIRRRSQRTRNKGKGTIILTIIVMLGETTIPTKLNISKDVAPITLV